MRPCRHLLGSDGMATPVDLSSSLPSIINSASHSPPEAFVPAPRAESPALRGLAAAASIAAMPGVANAGDDYLNYNMTGGLYRHVVQGLGWVGARLSENGGRQEPSWQVAGRDKNSGCMTSSPGMLLSQHCACHGESLSPSKDVPGGLLLPGVCMLD